MKILHYFIIAISIVAVVLGILILPTMIQPKGTGFTNGEAATLVLGQPNFTTHMSNTNATATGSGLGMAFELPGLAFDSSGNLWVVDGINSRILMYPKGTGFTNGESATLVLGQPNFATFMPDTSATGLRYPIGLAFDSSGNLWVSDSGNSRILMYPKGTGFTNGEAATLVLGQSSFTMGFTNAGMSHTNVAGLRHPLGLAFDSSGNLWVADGNSRVLMYPKGAGFTNGEDATLVLGQSSFTSFIQDASATGLRYPIGLAFDSSGNLWVSDGARILMYPKSTGFTNGQSATLVLGQPNFTTDVGNTTATTLSYAYGLAFDSSGNLWASDSGNNRVLMYPKGTGFTNGESATLVLGQPNFATNTYSITATGLSGPFGLAFDSSGNLWVADSGNNRVLEYNIP